MKRLLVGLLFLLFSTVAWAQAGAQLSEIEIYTRCYVRMVRMVPNEQDALFQAVKSEAKSGAKACLELFDRAAFTAQGVLQNRSSLEAKAILKNFNDQHRSWFQSKMFPLLPSQTLLIRDAEEPALYFTRAAFLPNTEFKTVLTLNTSLYGVRDRPNSSSVSNFVSQRVFNQPAGYPYSNLLQYVLSYQPRQVATSGTTFTTLPIAPLTLNDADLVQTGDLVGVKTAPSIFINGFYGSYGVGNAEARLAAVDVISKPFDLTKHHGGGVIGSQVFLMNNANLGSGQLPQDYALINRRLSSRIYEDLLCHELPTLTAADIATEVLPNSAHMFQRTSSCMRCHSTIDGTAYSMRNLVHYTTSATQNPLNQTVGIPVSGIQALPTKANNTLFALQTPTGRLHYRELVTKKRVNYAVSSLQQMGVLLSQGQDFYTCAAKRYYRFLTGIDVALGEAANEPLDKYHQDLILRWGANFKEHQSVRLLLQDIFSSRPFRTRDFETTRSP